MRENRPLVSVIMPSYNSEKYIEEAIRSVQSQTVTDLELIIVDDGSEDATCDIVERIADKDERVFLIKNVENKGTAHSRNKALDICKGEYVAFLDSDDIWHPGKLERQLSDMNRVGADLAYSSYSLIDESGNKVKADYVVPDEISYDELKKENVIGCSTVVMNAILAGKYRFNSGFYHEDYAMWLLILKEGYKAVGCPEILVNWRYMQNSRSFNKLNAARKRWKIYRECLGLPFLESISLMSVYIMAGVKKYK